MIVTYHKHKDGQTDGRTDIQNTYRGFHYVTYSQQNILMEIMQENFTEKHKTNTNVQTLTLPTNNPMVTNDPAI